MGGLPYYGALEDDAKDELSIHIGEIHSEPELMAEFCRTFPSDSNECVECGVKVGGEYVQKEHRWRYNTPGQC